MTNPMDDLSLSQRAFILAKTFQSIPLYFAHWQDSELRQDDLDAAFAALTEEALACESRKRFSLLLMAFLARLNNGHTGLRDPYLQEQPPLGMTLRLVEDRWTAVASDLPGLHAGDAILAIEDRATEAWYEELRSYAFGSPQLRTTQFDTVLRAFLPDRYRLLFADAHGIAHALTVDRTTLAADATPECTEGRWLADGLAYIKAPSFMRPEFEQRAQAYVEEFAQAAALIIDVRGNRGGNTPGALTRALMDRPYRWWTESSPLSVGLLMYRAQQGHGDPIFGGAHLLWRAPASDPDPAGYKGRLMILVDHATMSAAEDFVMPFKDNGRAVILGETTGGSTGQPFNYTFDQGIILVVGTKRATMPDGTPFEGLGHTPDVPVAVRREDLYAGRDAVLEKAVALAGEA